ncbi:hypothetical protein M3Y99_00283400 [Aphelenchoides fujianensis]|nr:hypothetical protein M3Y99_00283400 [Aphelenchoides fujianensis]
MARFRRNRFAVYLENVNAPSVVRIKALILGHLFGDQPPDGEELKAFGQLDAEWAKLCGLFGRYRHARRLLAALSDVELRLSCGRFDARSLMDACRSPSLFLYKRTRRDEWKKALVCLEPELEADFVQRVIDDFYATARCSPAVVCIAVHSFLHRVWTKAARAEIRPLKRASGVVVHELSEDFDFECKCPKNFVRDTFVFKNHAIDYALVVEVVYAGELHRLAVRLLRFTFQKIPPLHTRKRPRSLTFDILFDVTTFLQRQDLDALQLVSREWWRFIENNRNGFALHNLSMAKLQTKGDFFCFGVFERSDEVHDFRERRCNSDVTSRLFYPLLRNSSLERLELKRIDLSGVFDRFQEGIRSCFPLQIKRIAFSAADSRHLERILGFTEWLGVREYELDVFSADFFRRILREWPVRRCARLIIREQFNSRRTMLDELFEFLVHAPRPECTFALRNCGEERAVNEFVDRLVAEFRQTKRVDAFHRSALLVFALQPTELPRSCTNAVEANVNDCFEFERPTVSAVFHFKNAHSADCFMTACIGRTAFFPVQRVCHFELGRRSFRRS